jgi:5-methylcytosine-specific restriction endonuclease McrA
MQAKAKRTGRQQGYSPPVLTFNTPENREKRRRFSLWANCPAKLRQRVREAFDWQCQYCGLQCRPGDPPQRMRPGRYIDHYGLTVDRIIPACQDGLYVPSNVTLACRACNSERARDGYFGAVRSLADVEGAQ